MSTKHRSIKEPLIKNEYLGKIREELRRSQAIKLFRVQGPFEVRSKFCLTFVRKNASNMFVEGLLMQESLGPDHDHCGVMFYCRESCFIADILIFSLRFF